MVARKRNLKKELFWRRMIEKQAFSGMAVAVWCSKRRLDSSSFYWWRRELARRDAEKKQASFVPVHIAEDLSFNSSGQIEIVLVGGRRVCIRGRVDRQMLSDVLAMLTSVSSVESEKQAC
jgi:antitoxin component of MazEF toxin-antitoxin module